MNDYYNTQVEIYMDTAFGTLVDIINARYEPSTLSEIKGHGAGSFKVSKHDPKIAANPNLLAYRNYVKIRLNGNVIGGFIIQTKKTVIVGAGEESDEMWELSGEGPRSWVRDASVYPPKGLKNSSAETRYFNFSTERGSWYNSALWPYAIRRWAWNNVKNGAPKGHAPANWPDAPGARWIWNTAYDGTDPKGFCYFRHEFTTPGSPGTLIKYAFFIAADDAAEVYVDGEQKAVIEQPGWHDTTRVELELEPGSHVIGVKAYNYKSNGPGEILTALFTYGDASEPTSATLINHSGQENTWRVNAYPSSEPGWNIGDVLLTLLNEAKTRGVRFANNFTPTFTASVDSAGNAWPEPISWSFDVGATYEDVISAVEELGCDVWVNPDTLQMYAWLKRGVDRSVAAVSENAIVFTPGHNLMSGDETGQAQIANTLMLRTPEGWKEEVAEDTTSLTRFGRIETQLSTRLTAQGAKGLVNQLFAQKALPEVSATFEIVPVPGMIPFIDFNVGDWVSAPGVVPGSKESRRVMSLAFSEDGDTGLPIYAVEFDTIFKDRQTELERWVSRMSNSSAIGGGFTNSSNLPPTVIVSPPGTPAGVIPDAPTGLVVSSLGVWLPDGTSSSDYGLTWNPVITGSGFGTVTISQYEVWGRLVTETEASLVAVVFDTMAYLTGYRPGDEWVFTVRAVARSGDYGDFSGEVALVAEAPLLALEAPTPPVLSSELKVVKGTWDGNLGSSPAPAYMKYVRVERKPTSGSTWTSVGSLIRFSFQDYPGDVGASFDYRYVAVDIYDRDSAPSASTTVEVQGIAMPDLDQEISDALSEALIGSVDEYAISASSSVPPTTGWSTATPSWTPGNYIWTRNIITFANGATATGNPVLITGNPGVPGVDGEDGLPGTSSYTHIAYADNATGGGFSQNPLNKAYIGIYVDSNPTDSSDPNLYAWSLIKGADGEDGLPGTPGDDGLTPYFHTAWSDSADGTVNFNVSTPGSRTYLGTYTDFTEADSTNPATYSWMKIQGPAGVDGTDGTDGTNGRGVSSIVEQYYQSTSATTQTGGSWSTTVPTWVDGRYVWTRSVITYTDSTSTTTTPVNSTGSAGTSGSNGVSVTAVDIMYYLSTSATVLAGGTWSTTPPAWVNGRYMWSKTVTTFSNGTSTETAPVSITGSQGSTGKGVSSVTRYYFLSSSATAPAKPTVATPPSPWATTEPSYTEGSTHYLYTTDKTLFSDGTFTYSDVSKSSSYEAAKYAYAQALQAKQDAANAMTTANGKNKIVRSTANASLPENYVAGDQWWKYSGSQITAMWIHDGTTWVSQTLTDSVITNLNAGTITTGFLNAARIDSKTITAEKLVISAFGNLIPNGSFVDGTSGWSSAIMSVVQVTDGPVAGTVKVARISPVSSDASTTSTAYPYSQASGTAYTPGASYEFRLVARVVSGTAGSIRIRLGIHGQGQTNTWPVVDGTELEAATATPGQWVTLTGTYTAPENDPRDKMAVSIHTLNASGTVFEVSEISMRLMASGNLIVDGGIQARHVTMDQGFADQFWANEGNFGQISVDMVTPNFGEQLVLSAASSVDIIIGQNQALNTKLSDLNTIASDAKDAADSLAQPVADASDELESYRKVFSFTEDGFVISQENSDITTLFANDSMSIRKDGTALTKWTSEQMTVPRVEVTQIQIGNTMITTPTDKSRTTWQRL